MGQRDILVRSDVARINRKYECVLGYKGDNLDHAMLYKDFLELRIFPAKKFFHSIDVVVKNDYK